MKLTFKRIKPPNVAANLQLRFAITLTIAMLVVLPFSRGFAHGKLSPLKCLPRGDVRGIVEYAWLSDSILAARFDKPDGDSYWFKDPCWLKIDIGSGKRGTLPFVNKIVRDEAHNLGQVRFSPDGRRIAWVTDGTSDNDWCETILHVSGLNGGSPRVIPVSAFTQDPVWDSAGSEILLEENHPEIPGRMFFGDMPFDVRRYRLGGSNAYNVYHYRTDPSADAPMDQHSPVPGADTTRSYWIETSGVMVKPAPFDLCPIESDTHRCSVFSLLSSDESVHTVDIGSSNGGQVLSLRPDPKCNRVACAALCHQWPPLLRALFDRLKLRSSGPMFIDISVIDLKGGVHTGVAELPLDPSDLDDLSYLKRPLDLQWLPGDKCLSFVFENGFYIVPVP